MKVDVRKLKQALTKAEVQSLVVAHKKLDVWVCRARNNGWKFDEEVWSEILGLLTENNSLLYRNTPLMDFRPEYEAPSKNEAVIDHRKIGNLEDIAFHVGYPHQKKLCSLVTDRSAGMPHNRGVFFSMDRSDLDRIWGHSEESQFQMVYFLDIRSIKETRVQTCYESYVLSRYDAELGGDIDRIRKNLGDIDGSKLSDAIASECLKLPWCTPLALSLALEEETVGKDVEFARKKHEKLLEEWIQKYTCVFEKGKVKHYKENFQDWLIVGDPVTVKY